MFLQDLGGPARPMTTATARLNTALITLAQRHERPRCADPITHTMWTSDDQHDRQIAVAWCAGCPIIVEWGKPQTLEMNAGTSGADVTTHANHETNEQPERLASTHRRHPRRTRS
jgi:hypothetical protein